MRIQDQTFLRVLKTVAAVATRTQDRTLLCVLKTAATPAYQKKEKSSTLLYS
jgi:hypothetical protein